MNIDDQKKYEVDVETLLNKMQKGHKLIIYKTLHNDGHKIADVDSELKKIKQYEPLKADAAPEQDATELLKQMYGLGYI